MPEDRFNVNVNVIYNIQTEEDTNFISSIVVTC